MAVIETGNHRIDEYSQRMLRSLDLMDSMAIPELCDEADIDDWHTTNYRLEQHLIPAGLVERVESEDDQKMYQLTPEGEGFIRDHGLERPVLSDVKRDLDELLNRVVRAEESSHLAERKVQTAVDDIDRMENELDDLRDSVIGGAEHYGDEYDTQAQVNFNRVTSLETDLREIEVDVDELKSQLDEIDQRAGEVVTEEDFQTHIEQSADAYDSVKEQTERLTSTTEDLSDRLEEIEQQIGEDKDGLFRKFLPLGLFILGLSVSHFYDLLAWI